MGILESGLESKLSDTTMVLSETNTQELDSSQVIEAAGAAQLHI